MSPTDLDRLYSTLCEALGRVGEERASLLLATLALDLMAGNGDAKVVQSAIERAEQLCGESEPLTARPCARSP